MVVVTSSSSSSSSISFDNASKSCFPVKFICHYGGRIVPRYPDGRLRYLGGEIRVLAVDRSLPFGGIMVKLAELCGWEVVNLRCQLPTEDLDALVSITSDEDLANVLEEYNVASKDRQWPIKIRAFLHPMQTLKCLKPETIQRTYFYRQRSLPVIDSVRDAGSGGDRRFRYPLVYQGKRWK